MIGITKKNIKKWEETYFGKLLIEQGIQKGIQKGKKEGMQEGIEAIAIKMKKQGLSIQLIQQITGLSKKKIEEL